MALAVEHEFGADDLHHLAAGGLCQRLGRQTGVKFNVVVQDAALDQLPRLQGVVRLGDEVFTDAVLADLEDGVDGVCKAPKLGPLLACQFHGVLLLYYILSCWKYAAV